MGDFRTQELSSGKIKVSKQETLDIHGLSWRISSSRNVGKREVSHAKREIDDFIESHKSMPLDELYEKYPQQYLKQLESVNNNDNDGNRPMEIMLKEWREWLDSVDKYSPSSRRQVVNIVNRHVKIAKWEYKDVRTISPKMIDDLILSLHKHESKSSSTLNQYRRAWNRFFDFLYNKGIRQDHPLHGYKWRQPDSVKKSTTERHKVFNAEQLNLLYKELDKVNSTNWQRNRALQLMIDTGIRSSESVLLSNEIISGAFSLSAEINSGSELYELLKDFYDANHDRRRYIDIIDSLISNYGTADIITRERLVSVREDLDRLSNLELIHLMNTLKFINKFKSAKRFSDFQFVNIIDYNNNLLTLDNFSTKNDLIFTADILPNVDSKLIIDDTLIRVEDQGVTEYIKKGSAKSEHSTNRAITLNYRARSTIVKIFRDWLKFAKYKGTTDGRFYYLSKGENEFITDADLRYTLKKTIDSLNKEGHRLPELSPHSLRHSWATIAVNKCRSQDELRKVSNELGHVSVAFTERTYYHRERPLPSAGLSNIH